MLQDTVMILRASTQLFGEWGNTFILFYLIYFVVCGGGNIIISKIAFHFLFSFFFLLELRFLLCQ